EHNPAYWCFISKSKEEVEQENDLYARIVRDTRSEFVYMLPRRTNQEKKVARILTGVSLPTTVRHFSSIQIQKQRIFFDRLLLSPVDELPYIEADLYKIKIIAVHTSFLFKYSSSSSSLQDDLDMAVHSIVNNNHDNVVNERQNVAERILSQKMSQLLTKNITDKKLCFINNIQYEINTTPSWLTKQNISFQ
ncbi:unnamed protein product, partial [Rotaria magnacalcarata]